MGRCHMQRVGKPLPMPMTQLRSPSVARLVLAVGVLAPLAVACDLAAPSPQTADAPEASQAPAADKATALGAPRAPSRYLDLGPIVYVDGIRVDEATLETATLLPHVRPEDIVRIEVAKGEAAEAIWGEEAASGVIQVFTKAFQPNDATGAEAHGVEPNGQSNSARIEGMRIRIRGTGDPPSERSAAVERVRNDAAPKK